MLFFLLISLGIMAQEARFGIGGQVFQVANYQIVVPVTASAWETKAASELQKYLLMVTGVRLDIVGENAPQTAREIVIGYSGRFPVSVETERPGPDGFEIIITWPDIFIAGGSHKGTLYGVYEFLEKYVGCRFWAPGAETVPTSSFIRLPLVHRVENPVFGSREVYYAGMDDQDFADKMRSDRHAWKGGEDWGLWVHTMFTLVPPEKYFDSHPEYYAMMGGKRTKTQLCLSNPEVLQITIDELKRRMKEKPLAKYWSVSQMDTFGSCECDACKVAASGSSNASEGMIAFVNKVAAAFPAKVISTLAYQYTRKAPEHVKPAENVNIMLCTIECDRSKPLAADTAAGSFQSDLRHWSAIAGDILVWDYVIQFTNMIGPFPNLKVLQPNLQLFEKYHVGSVFEQGCHGTYSENQELRQYLLARLLWNPGLNADSIRNQFLTGYYGAAAPFISRYLGGMETALARSGKTLWIYDSPMQETDAFLNPDQVREYHELFSRAEAAVSGDSTLAGRVARAGLPLRYAILEISKKYITGPEGFLEPDGEGMAVRRDRLAQLGEFVALAEKYGVKSVHERGLSPAEYGKQTELFFRNAYVSHVAKDKPCSLAIPPASKYAADGPGSLTDGKRGSSNYHVLWQGFEENDLSAVIDLGKPATFNYVGAEFLQDLTSWIFYPEKLTVSISEDGLTFRPVAVFDSLSFTEPLLIRETGKKIAQENARFVRFDARNKGQCPAWHIGHGGKAWLFADELVVDNRP